MPIVCLFIGIDWMGPQAKELTNPTIVRFGFASNLLQDVNPDDALAATKVWAEALGKQDGLWESTDAYVIHDFDEMIYKVNNGLIDIIALSLIDYLAIENNIEATPILTYTQGNKLEVEYVLIVHKESHVDDIGKLRDKRVIIFSKGGSHSLASPWLDVLLFENGFSYPKDFFGKVKHVNKPSQALLPVFFRQQDAAVLSRSAFETASELNPQIGRELKVLCSSDPYVTSVICMRDNFDDFLKSKLVDIAAKIHERPKAFQTFAVFKLSKLVTWNNSYSVNVKRLLSKYKRLSNTTQSSLKKIASTGQVK